MRINLFFFLARFGLGGAGNSVYRLCQNLDKNKYNVNVICLNKCAYETKLKNNGVKVYKIKSSRAFFSIFKINNLLKKIIHKNEKNIFISNINYTNILCALLLDKNLGLKLIGIERTPLKELEIYFGINDFLKKTVIKILIHFFYNRFDKIICNSKYLGNYLKEKYGFKSNTIYPPSIITLKKCNFNKKYKLPKIIQITTVCRLSKEKNIKNIIYALDYLKEKKNLKLNIIGNGPEKNYLKNLTRELNIHKNVKFYGYKSKVDKFLSKSHLYLNTSFFEGFPNSVVEAVNHCVPVISAQSHGGINEILIKGKGGTIYYSDYKDLADYLKKFLNNPNYFYKKAKIAKKNVLKFTLENHCKNFEKLITKI